MKGTVEEKIYELQEKKKSLIDQMIQPGENFLAKLTDEEIRALFQADSALHVFFLPRMCDRIRKSMEERWRNHEHYDWQ